jgi:hypothetical protein
LPKLQAPSRIDFRLGGKTTTAMTGLGQSRRFGPLPATSGLPRSTDIIRPARLVRLVPIQLQKSKVASVRIFGETLKREAIGDSNDLSRITEVAYEFSVRR